MAISVVLIAGTGVMGKALIELLENNNDYNVYVTSRNEHNGHDNITYIQGNALDDVFLNTVLFDTKPDIIVDFLNYEYPQFESRYQLLCENSKQYFFLSSARVYSDKDTVITEKTPRLIDVSQDKEYLRSNEYSIQKAMQETLLLQSYYDNYVIIRPYIVFGRNRLQLGSMELSYWMNRVLRNKNLVLSKKMLRSVTSMTSAWDMANILKELFMKPSRGGKIINIANPQEIHWEDVLDIYLSELKSRGINPKIFMEDNETEECSSYGNQKYQLLYDRYFDRRFDLTNLYSYLGYEYQFKNISGEIKYYLGEYISKYKKSPYVTNLDAHIYMDIKTGNISNINEFYSIRTYIKYLQRRISKYLSL